MCTRFVHNGSDTIVKEKDKFYIGIKMPDGEYHSFHGINKNGNVGTLLYVNGKEKGKNIADKKRKVAYWLKQNEWK